MLARVLSSAFFAALLLGAGGMPAAAAGRVICDQFQTCWIEVGTPGEPGTGESEPASGGSGTGARVCRTYAGNVVPCFSDHFGWFNDADWCYYEPVEPQPPGDDPIWLGNFPDGTVWSVVCPDRIPGTAGGWVWLASPPPGVGAAAVTPAQLAQRAVSSMRLTGPAIRTSIAPELTGTVGVPLWLWTEVSPTTWGPNSATASVPGLAVTATAQAVRIVWDMGDGQTVTCDGPGTAVIPGVVESPTCDHVYTQPSAGQPGDAYQVTATATWQVSWTGGGEQGSLTLTRTSSSSVRIGEVQVLVNG